MTAHDHRKYVEGCFRCDLSRDGLMSEAQYELRGANAMQATSSHLAATLPIRQKRAQGTSDTAGQFGRRCVKCGAGFLDLAFGKTGECGLWEANSMRWYCSQECFEATA